MVKSGESGHKFSIDFVNAVSGFSNAMQKFPLKLILYRTIFRGKGLEFDSYRNFEQDDDASMIDWKASLRSNTILAKKYIEERELNVYFIVDCSGSVLFGSGDKLKAEFNAEVVAALSHLVLEGGDKVGLIMLNDGVVKYLEAKKGKNQFYLVRDFLNEVSFYHGGFDLRKAIDFTLDSIKSEYTFFIIISDFINLKRDAVKGLKFIGNRFETIAIMSRDEMDNKLPNFSHQMSLIDPHTGRSAIVDPKMIEKTYEKMVKIQKRNLEKVLLESNIDLLELNSNKSFFLPVAQFLRSRSKGDRI